MLKEYTTDFVTSKDGTRIGYRQLGSGPGIILVHGGMMAAQNFMKLGQALANEFTVYIPDRRGRGLSGPHGLNYSLKAESEDLQAIIARTKAEYIFGLSSGAICTLQTAFIEPSLKKVALFEPPIPIKGATQPWFNKYKTALSKGNYGKAMITVIKGTGEPSFFTALPEFITAPLLNLALKADEKNVKGDDVSLKSLVPTIYYDLIAITESGILIENSKSCKTNILLLGGSKSQRYLKLALSALENSLPNAQRIELKGLGHTAPDNGDQPEIIARELRNFFTDN